MKKITKKPLHLATETIRPLTANQLHEVAGGGPSGTQCTLNTCLNLHCRQK